MGSIQTLSSSTNEHIIMIVLKTISMKMSTCTQGVCKISNTDSFLISFFPCKLVFHQHRKKSMSNPFKDDNMISNVALKKTYYISVRVS